MSSGYGEAVVADHSSVCGARRIRIRWVRSRNPAR